MMSLGSILDKRRLYGRPLKGKKKGFWGTYFWWRGIGISLPVLKRHLTLIRPRPACVRSSNFDTATKGE